MTSQMSLVPETSPADDLPDRPEELLARVARRDHDAFTDLYDLLGGLVYGICLRLTRSPSLADEVSQETFIQVWTQADRYDLAKGGAKAWVATLAHRRAVDTVRHDQSAAAREVRASRADGPEFDVVAETAELNAEQLAVRACIGCLTPLQQEAVTLAYYDGMTYLEVAERLGVNHATVKTRIRDGLGRLQACLGPT